MSKRVTETIDWGTKPASLGAAMKQMPQDTGHKIAGSLKESLGQGSNKKAATKPQSLKRTLGQ